MPQRPHPFGGDYITSAEYQRHLEEEAGFRLRLEQRIDRGFVGLQQGLTRLEGQVREANGKTGKHAEVIAVVQRDIEAIKQEDNEIEKLVTSIKDEGCSQYAAHATLLAGGAEDYRPMRHPSAWSNKTKGVALGAVILAMLPALSELVHLLHDFVTFLAQLPAPR